MMEMKVSTVFLAAVIFFPLAVFAGFTGDSQLGAGNTSTLAWGDADGDGDLDVALGNDGQQNYLYLNDGGGSFTGESQFGIGATYSMVWGDYDNDGDPDLAVGNYGQQNYLYVNNGDGTFSQESEFGVGFTMTLAWADADIDGDLDLAVAGSTGGQQNYLYVNNGDGTFTQENQFGNGLTLSVAWGDYDADGDPDLAVGNYSGIQNELYVNNGDGTYTQENRFGFGSTRSVAWGDYDNDGDLDLAVGNSAYEQNYLYVNEGDGTFTEESQFGTGFTESVAWADADNDGDLDLAVVNYFGAQNHLYVNNGDGTFTQENEFGAGDNTAIAWGDADADGDLDLAVAVYGAQDYVYVNDENDGDYLTVRLCGHFHDEGNGYSNRDGVGAKVLIYEEEHVGEPDYLLGFREIRANAGFSGQDSIDAEFGLPDHNQVDVLVIWPGSDGNHIEEYWEGVAKTQFITLDEGTGTQWDVGIHLVSFEASSSRRGVVLTWDVYATEDSEIAGFNLYRYTGSGGSNVKTIASRDKLNAGLITGESPYMYLDMSVKEDNTYNYWLEAIDVGGASEIFGPAECTWNGSIPTAYALYQSRPNPARGSVTIAFGLPEGAEVTLTVYDFTGRKISVLLDNALPAGEHEAEVPGLAPGVYVYKLETGEFNAARKMVIVE